MPAKKGCTPDLWIREATAEAVGRGLEPAKVLSGSRQRRYVSCRWATIVGLVRRGFSRHSVAKASGYDHTTVGHACRKLEPRKSGPVRRDYILVGTGLRVVAGE